MSAFPNDLQFVSEFAQQDILARGPQHETATQKTESIVKTEETKIETNTASTNVQVENEPNVETEHDIKPEQMDVEDSIDNAIAGKKTKEGYESSDLDLSSDESDSEEEEEEEEKMTDNRGTKRSKMDLDDFEDDELLADGIVKTAHEITDFTIEKPQFEITPDTPLVLAGNVYHVIDNVVVVHCRPGSEFSTLDQGSLLVFENRQVLGEVFETFGPVARPYYSVRFNTAQEIDMALTVVGAPVFFVPSYQKTQIVEVEALKKIKGSDASNMYDEEVEEEEMEFSDDEKELEYKRQRNQAKKMKKKNARGTPNKQTHGPPLRRMPVDDFNTALDNYPMPPRQQQSYEDLLDEYTGTRPQQQQQQQQQQAYQSPEQLVSALYQNNQQPRPKNLMSIFGQAPPPISELERQEKESM
ncbi:hypothetical protein CU098_010658 [Rhizopus stolonifer]|uniref:H/ACA ribonucleoprotein complex non-core subunit NAF1 n=1 Tax=Rhizopus stolonifer TaxID=4846 RepID=A0A367KDM7_RHIST|nr:hypothetical protein CU098_010658 [Rhizopus stolonifer]